MTHDEQLVWERRAGKPAAAAAFGSALFGIAALAVGTSLQQKQPLGDAVDELVLDHKHPGLYLAGAVLQALSLILLTGALVYLYRATRYRRPQIQRPIYYLAMVLPTAVGILTVVSAIEHLNAADRVIPKLPLPRRRRSTWPTTRRSAAAPPWRATSQAPPRSCSRSPSA